MFIAEEIQKRLINMGLKDIYVETTDYFDKLYIYKVKKVEVKVLKHGKIKTKTKIKHRLILRDDKFEEIYKDLVRAVLNPEIQRDILDWYAKELYDKLKAKME